MGIRLADRLRPQGSIFMRRRAGRQFASVLAMRAMQSWKRSCLPWCARAVPSWMPAERGRMGAAARALPADLADWRATMEFVLDRLPAARILRHFRLWMLRVCWSATTMLLPAGLWHADRKLAAGLPVRLSTPVTRVEWDRSGVNILTSKGSLRSRAAIVTASTNVLAAGKIVFKPELSKRQLDAAAALSLGSYDHIALDMPRNPLNLQRDDLVFEKSSSRRTAALLANVSGSSLHLVEVGGEFGRELSATGSVVMVEFAHDWLTSLFGSSAKKAIKRSYATRWNEEPFVLGAMSAAVPGSADARKILAEPIGDVSGWRAKRCTKRSRGRSMAPGIRATHGGSGFAPDRALKKPEEDKPPQRSQQRHRRRRGPMTVRSRHSSPGRAAGQRVALHEARRAGDFDIVEL